jgi:zinc transporter ZupT
MVTSFFMEILPKSTASEAVRREYCGTPGSDLACLHNSGAVVLVAAVSVMAVVEVLANRPAVRLRRLRELMSHWFQSEAETEGHGNCTSEGTQLAVDFITSQMTISSRARSQATGQAEPDLQRVTSTASRAVRRITSAATTGSECRAETHDILRGAREQNLIRHMIGLAQRVREEMVREETVTHVLCRLTGRSVVEIDHPISCEQFHVMMRRLIGTCRTRNRFLWEDLCKRCDGNWPTLAMLAAALSCVMAADGQIEDPPVEDMAAYGQLRAEISGYMAPDVLRITSLRSLTSGESHLSTTSTCEEGELWTQAACKVQGLAARGMPLFEVLLETVCAGTLHFVTGISLGLILVEDFRNGFVFAVLIAARNFPEGQTVAIDLMSLHRLSRMWAFFAASFLGLCDCLGAVIVCCITRAHGVLPGQMRALIYFVNGGIFLVLGIRMYLGGAATFNPENKTSTMAVIFGMLSTGIFLTMSVEHLGSEYTATQ